MNSKLDDRRFFLAVHRALNLTIARYKILADFFADDWQKCWEASDRDFLSSGLDARACQRFLTNRKLVVPDQAWEQLQKIGVKILVYGQEGYPPYLQHIYNPPVVLFVRGEIKSADFPALAVVGSRQFSHYGQHALEHIVAGVAAAGITIVSGLAYGADTLAHQLAIKHGARTIAVLGNAIDTIYPATNQAFAEDFLAQGRGAIVSEYFPGTETNPAYFPMRNRIISGLAKALLVAEAGERSGTLITAKLALDQGKEVFCVPGEIFARGSKGTNRLIAAGEAQLVSEAAQILGYFGYDSKKSAEKFPLPKTGHEQKILQIIVEAEKIAIDEIFRQCELSSNEVISTLSVLELKGFIKQFGPQTYIKNF